MTDPTPTLAAPDWRELCDLHGTNLSDGDGPDTWNFTADQFAAALRDALAATREAGPLPKMPTLRSLLHPHYEPGDGSADGAQLVDGEWWHQIMGCDSLQGVVDNARAVLSRWGGAAVPQQVAEISDRELLELAAGAIDGYDVIPLGKFEPESDLQLTVAAYGSELIAYGRAVWARAQAARPAIQPVPVSERLPEKKDLDENGRCWVYQNERTTTHWLPHWALPLPAADQQEGQGDA